nr:MAG: wsv199-like protein [Penaeus semisulcatus pemonivirus]
MSDAIWSNTRIGVFNDFQRSMLAEAENQWHCISDLCKPSTVIFVEEISKLVSYGGKDTDFSDAFGDNSFLLNEVDNEDKPLFLMCVNMAKMMPEEMAKNFMHIAIRKACTPHTIGLNGRINHMNNFALIFHFFGPSAMFHVYWELLQDNDPSEKVIRYLTHVYRGDITQVCHNVKTFESSKLCYALFTAAMKDIEVGATSESTSLRIASTLLIKMLHLGGPVKAPCLLAATSNSNFNEIHMAVLEGRIDLDSSSSYLDALDRPFLAFLGHLNDDNFMKVIRFWLPLIYHDVITNTVKVLLDKMCCDGCFAENPIIRNLSRDLHACWSSKRWSILMKRVNIATVPDIKMDMALISIYIDDTSMLCDIIDSVEFSYNDLKVLARFAADNPRFISVLTERYSWLAEIPVTPKGQPILHYAVSNKLPKFSCLLQVRAIRNNIDVLDSNGKTPLMASCEGEGCFQYFKALLKAGSRVNITTAKNETILHFLSNNKEGETLLEYLHRWEASRRMIPIPDVEVRRQPDNMTALQLALSQNNFELAIYLMQQLHASASSLYGSFTGINTADVMLLSLNAVALKTIQDCTSTVPSFIRIMYEYLDGKLNNPGIQDGIWPAFREPRVVLNSIYNFPKNTPLSRNLALMYLGRYGICEYTTNSTRADSLDVKDLQCAICLDNMDDHHCTSCSHRFHSKCLTTWVMDNSTCPICRSKDMGPLPTINESSMKLPDKPEKPLLNERYIFQPMILLPPLGTDVGENY